MALQIGRKGQLYVKKEAAYGTAEVLASTNALRHIEVGFGVDPFNRVTSPEKKQSPGPATRFDRKKTAELATLVGLVRPSGVLNTLLECEPILEAAFGALTNVSLASTVASAPVVGGCVVASAGTLAVGDAVLLSVTGETKSPFVRVLTSVAGTTLGWAPDLPSAQTAGDAVKGGITYKLTTDLAISMTLAHYVEAFKRALLGAGVDQLQLAFDANEEPRFTASGPAKEQITSAAQAKPAAFTTVGGNPPSGLIGELWIDATVYKFKSCEIGITNGLLPRDQEYGINGASEVYRSGRREITIALETFAELEATLYDKAESGAYVTLLKQTGLTEGNIVAVYAPKVEFKVPETDDPDEETNWSFSGMAIEGVADSNDELTLAIM